MPSDIQYGIDVANRRVLFDADEIKSLKKFSDPGFQVLGFKKLSCLSSKDYVKPGHFIYPDEKFLEGGSLLFNTLLKKCLEREMFVLCQLTTRRNSPPRLGSTHFFFRRRIQLEFSSVRSCSCSSRSERFAEWFSRSLSSVQR